MPGKLAAKVLDHIEPDKDKQKKWLIPQQQAEVSKKIGPAAQRIRQGIESGEKIIVCGDYDCDGVMATTIMVDGLRKAGAQVGFYIPDRLKEGYGLHADTVRKAHEKGYTLLITVDNGVKAREALELASELGMSVILTDHHTIDEVPTADYLVHPQMMEEEYQTLCGAGVAYELLRTAGLATDYHKLLAGVASVADVMAVTGETRYLIQQACEMLSRNRDPHFAPFIKDANVTEVTIGFQVAPVINAPGRLANLVNVNNIVRYFLTDDRQTIWLVSRQMTDVNEQRKKMTSAMLEVLYRKADLDRDIIYVEDESFHEGIIGLAAGNLCSQTGKPVIVAALNSDGYKASMRAPEGFDCMAMLEDFDGFTALGGHKGAAGFAYDLTSRDAFIKYLKTAPVTMEPVEADTVSVDAADITADEIEALDELRPFGPGFPMPGLLIEDPAIRRIFDLSGGKHRKFTLGCGLECLHFNQSQTDRDRSVCDIAAFVGRPSINTYNGLKRPQLVIDAIITK